MPCLDHARDEVIARLSCEFRPAFRFGGHRGGGSVRRSSARHPASALRSCSKDWRGQRLTFLDTVPPGWVRKPTLAASLPSSGTRRCPASSDIAAAHRRSPQRVCRRRRTRTVTTNEGTVVMMNLRRRSGQCHRFGPGPAGPQWAPAPTRTPTARTGTSATRTPASPPTTRVSADLDMPPPSRAGQEQALRRGDRV